MKCPKCEKELGVVWVGKPNEGNSIYKLTDVEYCWKCHDLFLAKPERIEVKSSDDDAESKLERVRNELMAWELRSKDSLITLSRGAVTNLLSYIKGEV